MLLDFLDPVKRNLKKYWDIVSKINEVEEVISPLSNEDLAKKTEEFKERLARGETTSDILIDAFAVVREVAKRTLNMRHFDVQILGGLVLFYGGIAEMKTGEGKTLVATLPLYLNALEGHGGHLVTVNDYLAKRDALWMGPIYKFLGLTVGVIQHEEAFLVDWDDKEKFTVKLVPCTRKVAYLADVTYGTNNEFGFDYLRDHLVVSPEDMVQRELYYAIVDEVDSILIDEARTPLIISGPAEESTEMYYVAKKVADNLIRDVDYETDEKLKTTSLTQDGVKKIEKLLHIDNLYDERFVDLVKHINQALRAKEFFHRDVDYIVKDGEVIIVDEFTGRLMFGRRYSDGLHQAIEAKEGLRVQSENQTLATITFQNYFRMYKKLAGMTGTALTEAREFKEIYNLDVYVIPTNKPVIRVDHPDVVYKTEDAKFRAIVRKIEELYKKGQPVLVGTRSIEKSERLSKMLKRLGIPHNVLNAKYHEKEAEIIKDAGQYKAVTIATNMAGRGVDIKLGEGVAELGGLFVLGTERHEARRIDNQLRGRSGRQGDPGESQFYLSLEDELMRLFGGDQVKSILTTLKVDEDEPIEHPLLSRIIENAQKKVEAYNFSIRKNLLDYDNVLEKQREVIYKEREKILKEPSIRDEIVDMIKEVIASTVSAHFVEEDLDEERKTELEKALSNLMGRNIKLGELTNVKKDELIEQIEDLAVKLYEEKEACFTPDVMRSVEKYLLLRNIDSNWKDHLYAMDELKEGIGLRAYGQKDPLLEYQIESRSLFDAMLDRIKYDTVFMLYRVELAPKEEEKSKIDKVNKKKKR
ncbi:preprotein translocase subunit SecA [Caldisericum exile]|uniref:Protein translocase subunit SecA n=1 Tax=Caldisericum exile (strain DSM 21853 / NBRC 104410 / AZM16c01) TaxID=511051 RepID=A0A7U6GEZ9_CALEA|nr:preprotein translocase subunit SecA [Caldisericum exile]BAL81182.1 protein translocase subunit SecA [Caldisericum exile AZM16c01]